MNALFWEHNNVCVSKNIINFVFVQRWFIIIIIPCLQKKLKWLFVKLKVNTNIESIKFIFLS